MKPFKIPGFTLIELLVAMVITGIMLTLVMASYWTFLQTNAKMAVSRELQSEVRFALTRLTDKIRSTTLNYAEYQATGDCTANVNQTLCLISPEGDSHFFEFDANQLLMGSDESDTQPLISPARFQVLGAHFGYSPQADPSVLSNPQLQPKVTVFLRVAPTDTRYQDLVIETQTTISSRQY